MAIGPGKSMICRGLDSWYIHPAEMPDTERCQPRMRLNAEGRQPDRMTGIFSLAGAGCPATGKTYFSSSGRFPRE